MINIENFKNLKNVQLERPVIFFDIESTGLQITKDEIVELCAYKINVDYSIDKLYHLIKPVRTIISKEAEELHGISLEKLADKSTFKDLADEIFNFFDNCDLGGYNIIRFDIPLLSEEFHLVGKHFNPLKFNIIDVFKILQEKEPRNLGVVYKYYTGKDVGAAHTAQWDIEATIEIFDKQLEKYDDMPKEFSNIQKEIILKRKDGMQNVDFSGLFLYQKGEFYYAHGKHKGQKIDKYNVSYLDWMLKADFTYGTKNVANMIKKRIQKL